MPLRRSSLPQGPDMRLYRRFAYGDLAEFSILDTRQYRTDQPCGDGLKDRCAEALSESQTMTGPEQERWLKDGLGNSRALWNVIGQQTMLAEYDFNASPTTELFNMDQWDGYVAARNRLIGFLNRSRVSNPITLTGDIHSSWVHDLKTDFSDETSKTVGTEFVGTSITSEFPSEFLAPVAAALVDNPHTKYFDGSYRGYVRCDVRNCLKSLTSEPNASPSSASSPHTSAPLRSREPSRSLCSTCGSGLSTKNSAPPPTSWATR
jgi:alkaline phosphatase D